MSYERNERLFNELSNSKTFKVKLNFGQFGHVCVCGLTPQTDNATAGLPQIFRTHCIFISGTERKIQSETDRYCSSQLECMLHVCGSSMVVVTKLCPLYFNSTMTVLVIKSTVKHNLVRKIAPQIPVQIAHLHPNKC